MAAREAIILAGGLGTRLSATVPGVQKCMAPVNGVPFLYYVIKFLQRNKAERFIFSVGYKAENIETFLTDKFPELDKLFVSEDKPLGTGGAIMKSLSNAGENNVLVLNGDTLFEVDLNCIYEVHSEKNADCTIALKPMKEFDRYGTVQLNEDGNVAGFMEKKFMNEGLINGGIYLLKREKLLSQKYPEVFSFEKEYLEKKFTDDKIAGVISDSYFIDIGVPEDYFRAQEELKNPYENG